MYETKYFICYYCQQEQEFKDFRPAVISQHNKGRKHKKLICRICEKKRDNPFILEK